MTASPHAASEALAREVRTKVREQGLVLWLDAQGNYADLVDSLAHGAHEFPYPVVTLRGSYLELMLALESFGNGLHAEHALVHLPGLNKDTVKDTPVYELYKAGTLFEKNLLTLVREAAVGRAKPEEVDAFLRTPSLRLADADAWFSGLGGQPQDRLGLLMQTLGLDDVVLGVLTQDARLREHLPHGAPVVLDFLERHLGLNEAWRAYRKAEPEPRAPELAALVSSWLMAVEFVSDLREPAATPELAVLASLGPVTAECRRLALLLRDRHPDLYEEHALALQEELEQERTGHHAQALGSIDTFRFEEATMRTTAFAALRRGDWLEAEVLATERTPERSFWVRRAPNLQRAWEMIRQAAALGRALTGSVKALDRCGSLAEAVERYTVKLAPIDRAHRAFEQRAHSVLALDIDDYDSLLDVRGAVRRAYRDWADTLNRAFHALCMRFGVLPDRSLRQRAIYEDVVHPQLAEGPVAYFLVDALRFEMAQALAADLKKEKFRADLDGRLAELPTDTVVGMNALAPVEQRNGRLRAVLRDGTLAGFMYGEFPVDDPNSRVRAMAARSLKTPPEHLALEDFEMGLTALKRKLHRKPNLIVIRSRELDEAGEHGLHLGSFDHTLALLKSAVLLLAQAGVERFVISSDHGFLLQDQTAENVPFGANGRMAQRRHALLESPSGMSDVLEVSLSELEYDVAEERFLVFRPDTALWAVKDKIAPFVHGGNSLQERVVPVLRLERQGARGKSTTKYEVVARAEPAHLGRQRLRLAVRLQDRQTGSLSFDAPKSVTLAIRVPGRTDLAITLLEAGPPATLIDGRIVLPPNHDEALVEFELEGELDEKVRIEIFHPDAVVEVASKVVEGFFDVARDRRLARATKTGNTQPPPRRSTVPPPPTPVVPEPSAWSDLVEDVGYRRVLEVIAERRSINEEELQKVLGSPRRVRAFARHFDDLMKLLPFEVEVLTVNGMKAYARK